MYIEREHKGEACLVSYGTKKNEVIARIVTKSGEKNTCFQKDW